MDSNFWSQRRVDQALVDLEDQLVRNAGAGHFASDAKLVIFGYWVPRTDVVSL